MILSVKVNPGSRKEAIRRIENQPLRINISARPVDGAANERLIEYLAEVLDLPKSAISILSGHQSKLKKISIDADEALVWERFDKLK